MDNQLRELSQLIQQRRYNDARPPLRAYVKTNPDAAYAWYLLSFAENTPTRKQAAIAKAAKLAPDNERFHERYVKLGAAPNRSRLLLVLLAVGLIGIAAVVVLSLNKAPANGENMPTLAALNTVPETSTAAETTPEIQSSVESSSTPPSPTAAEIVLTPVLTISSTLAEIVQPTLLPTEPITQPTTTASGVPQSIITAPSATLPSAPIIEMTATEILVTLVGGRPTLDTNSRATQPPTNTPLPSPTSLPPQPTATLIPPGSTVPLATFGNIGVGELQVIQVARPGSSFIQEIGGTAPNPPANQDWVLLEILLMCSTATNCAPAPTNLTILGSSGTSYTIPTTLQIDPPFGPEAFAGGQVWGFAGFLIPRSESTLSLVVTQGDQSFAFALQ
ncbi:MAG: hypothetical protein K8L97_33650 [Anaerolineae bacterium]|nr:hypothetical protein [Anaerolineae bacterium]